MTVKVFLANVQITIKKEDKMTKRVVILPMDDYPDSDSLLKKLEKILSTSAKSLISHIKLNDALHLPDCPGPLLVKKIVSLLDELGLKDIKIFLDLKLADTKGTNKNVVSHYNLDEISDRIDIITMRAGCSLEGIKAVKKVFPNAKIILVSVLTDMSTEECKDRYGLSPVDKIEKDIDSLIDWIRHSAENSLFDGFVCSPSEVEELRSKLSGFIAVTPGIRDKWMSSGQQDQERLTGVCEALKRGANFVVMGSQITKGNPSQGVSPEKSCQMTMEIINEWFKNN